MLKLTTNKGQENLCTVFIFVIYEEKSCYRIDRTAGSAAVCKAHLTFKMSFIQ